MHRWLGVALALFLIISASTGILLGWKKNSNLIQPNTQKGTSTELSEWLDAHKIAEIAHNKISNHLNISNIEEIGIDKMDYRPSKGIVKVLFDKGYWEVQVDGKTGEVLSVARRHSDWIESLHDGSIISQTFKWISMNILGIGLLLLILAGVWLWYGPKIIRKNRK